MSMSFWRRLVAALASDWTDDVPATHAAVRRAFIGCLALALTAIIITAIGVATNTHSLFYVGTILIFIAACWWTASARILIRYWRSRRSP